MKKIQKQKESKLTFKDGCENTSTIVGKEI